VTVLIPAAEDEREPDRLDVIRNRKASIAARPD
jgi:hypothetical protein